MKMVDHRILQTHGIQHTAGASRNARRRLPGRAFNVMPLEEIPPSAESGLKLCIFATETERAGRRNERVMELHTRNRNL